MPLRIGNAARAHRPSDRPRATDYTQRHVRWRLFTWLAMLMLVLALAERTSGPRLWRWWTGRPSQPAPTSLTTSARRAGSQASDALGTSASGNVPATGSAVAPGGEPTLPAASAAAPAAHQGAGAAAGGEREPTPSSRDAAPSAVDPQAIAPAVQRLWGQLSDLQRRQFAELVLAAAQPQPPLSPSSPPSPPQALIAVDWLDRIAGPDAPPDTPQAALRLALQAASAGQPLAPAQRELVRAVQGVLRPLALSWVEDGTAIFRPAEREVWFLVLEDCRRLGPQGLRRMSQGRVAYVQLDQQPQVYRGQVVTIVGRVRRAYRATALSNPLGVQEYAVYWVLTEGGPDAPVVVYALGIPPGFPELPTLEQRPGGLALNEPVEISGVFLKQAAYPAEGGVFTAPLLLAHTPHWQPPPDVPPPRGTETALLGLAVASLVSLAVVVWVWRRTRRPPGPSRGSREPVPLPAGLDVTPKLDVALHQLEESTEESQP